MKRKKLLFTYAFILVQFAVFAQSRVIKGTVKDSKTNETLPGVTVLVQGTTTATSTDAKGEFTISVEGIDKKLVVSSVGFATRIIPVAADMEVFEISLEASSIMLKEMVVTALGVSKEKKALGYSVSEVSGDDVRRSGESNIIEALAAKAPGVEVVGSGGTPGASTKITLRGPTDFSGTNQPIIVLDGVIMDNSTNTPTPGDASFNMNLQGVSESNRALDINPDDIESVSILKGPAAAALYGSAAANGAIVYTTKRGRGKEFGASYSSSVSMDKVSNLPKLQTTYAQGSDASAYSTATSNSWGPTIASLPGMTAHDVYKDYFQTGYSYTNNVSVYGGNDNSSLRLSAGNTNTSGIVPNSSLKRSNVRITDDTKITSKITAGGTVDYTNTSGVRVQNGSNLAGTMLTLTRTPAEFDITKYQNPDGTQRQYYSFYDNPLYSAYNNPYTDQTNRIIGNVFLDYKPFDFLDVNWKVGTDVYSTTTQQVYAISSFGNDNSDGTGQVNVSSLTNRDVSSNLIVKFNKQLSKDFGLDALVGHNFIYDESQSLFARGRTLTVPNYYNLNNAAELYSSNSSVYQKQSAVFLDATLNYKRMLYLNLTGRNEWNTAFGKSGKSFFYPKADVSWVFSELFKLPSWFSFGKIRAAYANTGIAPSPYSDRTYYGVPFFTDGYTNGNTLPYLGQAGLAQSNVLGNPDIKPERVSDAEGGFSLSFFNNRITTEFTYYSEESKDLLIPVPLPASTGYLSRLTNAGTMTNKGIELAVGGTPIKTKDFAWNINVGWSQNKNKVTFLANGLNQFTYEVGFGGLSSEAVLGQPYGAFYGSTWKRNSAGLLLLDANGLPQVNPTASVVGNPNPKWLMNINNTFTYKGWNFGFLWDIRKGGDMWNGTAQSLNTKGKSAATVDRNATYAIAGVYDAGTPNAGQAHTTQVPGYNGQGNDYFTYIMGQNGADENAIQDGGWVRLRSVSLSYRFDLTKKEKKHTFKYVELGASARNLYLHTKYTGVDPETSLTGAGSNIKGFDYFNNPGTKSMMFNLKVGI
jgi:TonB-linked SusC/RagA family outer membrane protein